MPDFNKWIRVVVKAKDENGLAYVWAVDYGVPVISNVMNMIKLPSIYVKMNVKYQRVFLGGLINCVPAESSYDIEEDVTVFREQTNWSTNSIVIAQSVIGRAISLEFEQIEEVNLPNGSHLFGHLKIQKADGSLIDLSACLCKALIAKTTNDTWSTHAHRLDTINQKEWVTMNGVLLRAMITVTPTSIEQIANETKLQCTSPAKSQSNNNKPRNEENQQVAADQQNTSQRNENSDNQNMHLPAGNSRTFKNRDTSSTRSVTGAFGMNFHGGGRSGYHHSRHNNFNHVRQNDFSAEFPKGWHSNGKLNSSRYREEIEYFESSFIPPTEQTKKEEPIASDETKELKTDTNGSDVKETNNENGGEKDEKPTKVESNEIAPSEKQPSTTVTTGTSSIEMINAQEPKKDDTENQQNENNNGKSDGSGGSGGQVNT